MEEAEFLTRFARSVTVVHRRDTFRASQIMLERARANPAIRWATHREAVAVTGDGAVTGLRLRDVRDGSESGLDVAGVFVAIGHDPRSTLVADRLDVDPDGYVRTLDGTTRTTVDGVFACGDLVDRRYRQAVTAAGSGCAAAIDAERWLAGQVTDLPAAS